MTNWTRFENYLIEQYDTSNVINKVEKVRSKVTTLAEFEAANDEEEQIYKELAIKRFRKDSKTGHKKAKSASTRGSPAQKHAIEFSKKLSGSGEDPTKVLNKKAREELQAAGFITKKQSDIELQRIINYMSSKSKGEKFKVLKYKNVEKEYLRIMNERKTNELKALCKEQHRRK